MMWVCIYTSGGVKAVGGFLQVVDSSGDWALLLYQLTLVSCGNDKTKH